MALAAPRVWLLLAQLLLVVGAARAGLRGDGGLSMQSSALERRGRSLAATLTYPVRCSEQQRTETVRKFVGSWYYQNDTEQMEEGAQSPASGLAVGWGSSPLVWITMSSLSQGIVKAFDRNTGARVYSWGTQGDGQDEIYERAVDIGVDGSGNVYVLDTKFVKKFNPKGILLARWQVPTAPDPGNGDYINQYLHMGMAVSQAGNVWVGTRPESGGQGTVAALFKFNSNGLKLAEVKLNGTTNESGELEGYSGTGRVAVDAQDNAYVIDRDGSGVLIFDSSLKFKSRMNHASSNGPGLMSVAIHHLTGRIFCPHIIDMNVQVFASGRYLSTMAAAGDGSGPDEGTLIIPTLVAVDNNPDSGTSKQNGMVYVGDNALFWLSRYNNGPVPACTASDKQCLTCLNPSTCLECKAGFQVDAVTGKCRAPSCLDADENCLECIASGAACETCKSGFEPNGDGQCQAQASASCVPSDPGCKACITPSECITCKDANYAPDGTGKCVPATLSACIKKDPNCQICSGTQCAQCKETKYEIKSGKCTLKPAFACQAKDKQCSSCATPTTCSVCKAPYLVGANGKCREKDCIDIDKNCKLCVNPTFCAVCKTNAYYVDGQGKCVPTSSGACLTKIANCKTCTNAKTCSACKTGFSLVGNQCVGTAKACLDDDAGCKTCKSATACSACKAGFKLSGGTCRRQGAGGSCNLAGCITCATATTCADCDNGYTLSGGKCKLISDPWTPSGPQTTTACKQSDPLCQTCLTASRCRACRAGAYLSDGTCYQSNGVQTCKTWDLDCLECATTTKCAQCKLGYFIVATGRCAPDPAYACLSADPYCLTCKDRDMCARCIADWTVGPGGKCTKIIRDCFIGDPYCTRCATRDRCAACLPGYSVAGNGKCAEGGRGTTPLRSTCASDAHCKTCLNASKCKTCKDSANFAVNPDTGACTRLARCTSSDSNCAKCDAQRPRVCLKCKVFYTLTAGNKCQFWGF